MSQHPDFVSEFDVSNLIEQAQTNPLGLPSDETAVQSKIAENTRSAEEVRVAFQAMQQAQQPTTFDKIGDIALAVAAIADLTTGDKRKRGQAGAKFRSLRAGRAERKQTKRDRQFQKFIQQMKLREFTGDISSRNFTLLKDLSKQERQNLTTNLDALFKGEDLASVKALRKAQAEKLGKEPTGPTAEEKFQAGQIELLKIVNAQVDKEFGTYDPNKHSDLYPTFAEFAAAKQARKRQLMEEIHLLLNPGSKPEKGDRDVDLPGLDLGQLPQLDIRDLIPQSGAPALSTGVNFPILSPADMARLGLGRQR